MSLTIEQLVNDAKKLAGRLKYDESIADALLKETNSVHKKIEAMKQFQEEVEILNSAARQKPHSQLIESIQQDNRHWKEIQQENRELRSALEDHQIALEHIMSKYRKHVNHQLLKTKVEYKIQQDNKFSEIIDKQTMKIEEMAAIMQKAANLDEEDSIRADELLTQLQIENKGLRELLEISWKHGSILNNNSERKTEDKIIQTEKF